MLCVRCSHPLAPRADRCVRCFALNPRDPAQAPAVPWVDSGPAAPVAASIASDPPVAPVAISFADEPAEAAVTEPAPPPSSEQLQRDPVSSDRVPAPAPAARRSTPSMRAKLVAWAFDAAVLLGIACWNAWAAGRICRAHYWLDFVRGAAPALIGMIGLFAIAYSWVFVALGGRTPGMALAGLRVRTLHGDDPTPAEALLRAALSLPSAALGMFGFLLALFDRRGQTLHDKLCRCVIRID